MQNALTYPGQLTIICIGPLTNIATALRMEPGLFMAIRRIVMMGGTSGLPFPEWNVRSDAGAARMVLASGIPITLLGMNITMRCQLQPGDIARLRACDTPQARLLSKLLAVWQRHRPRWQSAYPYLHDPLTIAALCVPQLLRFEEMTARVLVDGPLRGVMVPRIMDGPPVQAAVDIQADAAREWVMERLLGETQKGDRKGAPFGSTYHPRRRIFSIIPGSTASTASTSASVLSLPRVRRRVPRASSGE